MKKHGFTLAEVLITLSIIGVVAALTLPNLTQNVGGAKIGPSLAKFVNTFETATGTMMLEEGYASLKSLDKNDGNGENTLLTELSKYLIMSPIKGVESQFKYIEGHNRNSETDAYMLKDGMVMRYISNSNTYSAKNAYKGGIGTIYVNIAGLTNSNTNVKNRPGRETFAFLLDDSGILVPYGSKAHKHLTNLSVHCNPSGTTTSLQYACTGAFADNGWKTPKNY